MKLLSWWIIYECAAVPAESHGPGLGFRSAPNSPPGAAVKAHLPSTLETFERRVLPSAHSIRCIRYGRSHTSARPEAER